MTGLLLEHHSQLDSLASNTHTHVSLVYMVNDMYVGNYMTSDVRFTNVSNLLFARDKMSKYESLDGRIYLMDNTCILTITNKLQTSVQVVIEYQRSYEHDGATYTKDLSYYRTLAVDEITSVIINTDVGGWNTSLILRDHAIRTFF